MTVIAFPHKVGTRWRHDILFGLVHQPICETCDWTSAFVRSESRALEIAREHAQKESGKWRPAK